MLVKDKKPIIVSGTKSISRKARSAAGRGRATTAIPLNMSPRLIQLIAWLRSGGHKPDTMDKIAGKMK